MGSAVRRPPPARTPRSGLSRRRAAVYIGVALLITAWTLAIVYVAASVLPIDHYLISYYVVDYRFGFTRRGLAGEVVGNVSGADFFTNAYRIRWISTAVYLLGLAALAYKLLKDRRSERRIMVALLLAVLPFGVPYAVYSARPDLFGAVALIVLCLALTTVSRTRSVVVCCGLFGAVIAVLALMHEGMALEFGFGAILAILVLARGITAPVQRLCAALVVGPGLTVVLAVAAFANHDVSGKVCSTVPHRMIETPFASIKSGRELLAYLTGTQHSLSDYHDWVCGWYLSTFDHTVADGIREVAAVGLPALVGSFVLGLVGLALTLRAVSYFSGVSLPSFIGQLHGRFTLPACGLVLTLPLFVTGVDWTRWLLVVAFDVVVVYVLYASGRPEIDEKPPARAVGLLPLVALGFMLIPLGLAPGGGPTR
ncbi:MULTISPECIES: hypothetical protein [unclassified Mycolicibacterium]|uniref:hypothetical protein n=1 Tax=unclassified Mycolicibacterium TaxID=2636767 RepID=UPI0012DC82EE|nr:MULTISPECIES: hypothetical protein [unclassified Mycolicibacterium]MUL84556.1 hypothetical protein [Mycolicibacterium sp. CBMA 329]MUL88331.1 hypothetical protein [Mycolicibacterium sp. CBMA 331]MUL99220.1 hypothetical protein [Mycolicibacterium sp. CBMA 334]MUM27562.1 hypothetical protein [Mycolicibacterium sp. CBMA 295]MUM39978.1 hypothetical protein [Mycolicibacterium sp. CBMA 247]